MKTTNIKTVYVLHHTNLGTPESGEIHSIHRTESSALKLMKVVLDSVYSVTMEENEESQYDYMYISEQKIY
jgi:hypothetical protein